MHTRERNVRVHIATAQEYRSLLQRSRIGPRCPVRAYQPRTQSNHGAIASGVPGCKFQGEACALFIDSLARPGGNATGFTSYEYSLAAKWLELLKQIAPGVTRVAVLRDRPVRRHPGPAAGAQRGGEPSQRARRR